VGITRRDRGARRVTVAVAVAVVLLVGTVVAGLLWERSGDTGGSRATATSAPASTTATTAPTTTTIPSLADFVVPAPRPGDLQTSADADTLPTGYVAPATDVIPEVAYGPLPAQHLALYLPPGHAASDKLPVILYLHSGGWIAGNEPVFPEVIKRQATRARIAVVSADYRLVTSEGNGNGVNPYPASSYDVDRAVRFVKANAARWGLDPSRMLLGGGSSGAQLATLAAVASGKFVDPTLPAELKSVSPAVIGVIDMVGPSDFSNFADVGGWAPGLMSAYLGCAPGDPTTCSPAVIGAASPVSWLDAGDPPGYLIYGTNDSLVPPATQGTPLAYGWARARNDFARPAASRGVRYEITSGDHNVEPDNQNVRALEQWIDGVVDGTIR
jgi:acetyl esterase/lipase